MRIRPLSCLAALLLAVSLPVSAADTGGDRLTRSLDHTRDELRRLVAGLSAEQWSWKPAPDRWSVAECFAHLNETGGLDR